MDWSSSREENKDFYVFTKVHTVLGLRIAQVISHEICNMNVIRGNTGWRLKAYSE